MSGGVGGDGRKEDKREDEVGGEGRGGGGRK